MDNHTPDRNTVFVLFGAGGDLSKRLIVPALFNLHLDGKLPNRFLLVGVGHHDLSDEALAEQFREGIDAHSRRGGADGEWETFARHIRHLKVELEKPAEFRKLRELLDAQDQLWGGGSEWIFYMATPPTLFAPIANNLRDAGLAKPHARLVVEKPLGHDLDSFRAINEQLRANFEERAIFRIDHFLGKETVQNILALRFANPMFEPVWDRRYIDHVAITVGETLGVERRAHYYEHAGALRDMVQNHLMQLLCLVAMEPPVNYDADDIRNKKMDVLRAIRPIPADEVNLFAARGQYGEGWIGGQQLPRYREEENVAPDSNTETYAALKLFVDNWRWQDVPFYMRTGKRMAAKVSEISIRFRDVPHHAFPASVGLNAQPARLVIQIQPEQGIILKFTAKEPGSQLRLRPVDMRFSYREAFNMDTPDAYETLLWDVMIGDATLFMRADQVEAAWRIIMPVLEVWQNNPAPDFPNYSSGSWGPEAAELLVAQDGHSWFVPTLGKSG